MRKSLVIAVLCVGLAACSDVTGETTDQSAAEAAVDGFLPDKLIENARYHVSADFPDPESAQFREIQSTTDGYVCGEVNAKNRLGAYAGFGAFAYREFSNGAYAWEISDRRNPRFDGCKFFGIGVCNPRAIATKCFQWQREQDAETIPEAELMPIDNPNFVPDYRPPAVEAPVVEESAPSSEDEATMTDEEADALTDAAEAKADAMEAAAEAMEETE